MSLISQNNIEISLPKLFAYLELPADPRIDSECSHRTARQASLRPDHYRFGTITFEKLVYDLLWLTLLRLLALFPSVYNFHYFF